MALKNESHPRAVNGDEGKKVPGVAAYTEKRMKKEEETEEESARASTDAQLQVRGARARAPATAEWRGSVCALAREV
ncbi:uncharacterized [Tachysurus ichikawai]